MNSLFRAARELQEFCDAQGWRSCFIGGLAVQRWGEPRLTGDVDVTLLAGFGNEAAFVDPLLDTYEGRIADARDFALRHRVLLLRAAGGAGIDISLAALPFEESVVRRATAASFGPLVELRTCSAEDLIVLKLFASRPLDLHDVEGVAIRQKGKLDWAYMEEQLRPLSEVKERPDMMDALARLKRF
jgi:hypothetical protein